MTRSHTLHGKDRLRAAVAILIEASAWFQVTPLPDDEWRITVKPEHNAAIEMFALASQPECPTVECANCGERMREGMAPIDGEPICEDCQREAAYALRESRKRTAKKEAR